MSQLILDDHLDVLRLLPRLRKGFWDRDLCHPGYSILVFPVQDKEQLTIPGMLRELFRYPQFQTRRARMGKIARVSKRNVAYWEFREADLRILPWKQSRRKTH